MQGRRESCPITLATISPVDRLASQYASPVRSGAIVTPVLLCTQSNVRPVQEMEKFKGLDENKKAAAVIKGGIQLQWMRKGDSIGPWRDTQSLRLEGRTCQLW